MDELKPSPLPWRWEPEKGNFIVDAKGNVVGEIPCQGANPDDGALIVKAVNAYQRTDPKLEALREAAKELVDCSVGPQGQFMYPPKEAITKLAAALSDQGSPDGIVEAAREASRRWKNNRFWTGISGFGELKSQDAQDFKKAMNALAAALSPEKEEGCPHWKPPADKYCQECSPTPPPLSKE